MMITPSLSLQFKAGDLQIVDPNDLLKECIVFFAFPKSRSANFPIALSLAQAAFVYGEQDIGGRTLYWAGFTKVRKDIEKAAELLRLAGGWVGSIARVNGCKVTRPFNAYLTLSCYLEALQCSNSSAHCLRLIEDPFHPDYDEISQTVKRNLASRFSSRGSNSDESDIKRYVFPCKQMLAFSLSHPVFRFKQVALVSPQDEIQAAAVEYGISICPLFDSSKFYETDLHGTEIEIPMPNIQNITSRE